MFLLIRSSIFYFSIFCFSFFVFHFLFFIVNFSFYIFLLPLSILFCFSFFVFFVFLFWIILFFWLWYSSAMLKTPSWIIEKLAALSLTHPPTTQPQTMSHFDKSVGIEGDRPATTLVDRYFHHFFSYSLLWHFSHSTSARIKKLILRKLFGAPILL